MKRKGINPQSQGEKKAKNSTSLESLTSTDICIFVVPI